MYGMQNKYIKGKGGPLVVFGIKGGKEVCAEIETPRFATLRNAAAHNHRPHLAISS